MKTTKKHVKSFHIAGYQYYQGPLVFKKLKIGKKVRLVPEPHNRFDEHAIAIYYKDHQLGYLPKGMNKTIATLLNAGYTDVFTAVIQHIDPTSFYEGIRVVIYVKPCNTIES